MVGCCLLPHLPCGSAASHPPSTFNAQKNAASTAVTSPPGPISGEIEERHEPEFLLSNYHDEARWSATIAEWGGEHTLFIDADEE
jgi:hypothetical protein